MQREIAKSAPSQLPRWWADAAALGWFTTLFAVLCTWSWRKWADLYIDSGRELYIPWQLAQGKVLYRDIYLEYGPLSKYFNAAVFALFGTSFQTLFVCNLVILALFVLLLYRFIVEVAGRWAATIAISVFLCVLAFSQHTVIANYNFVAPYSHEATHGLMLSFVMLFCLWRCLRNCHWRWLAAAGLCAGGVVLTKPELGLAASGAAGVFALALVFDREVPAAVKWRGAAAFIAGTAALPLLFFAYFLLHMPLAAALQAAAGAWMPLWTTSDIGGRHFDRWVMGLDEPRFNGALLVVGSVVYAVVLGSLFAICRWLASYELRLKKKSPLLLVGSMLAAVAAYFAWQGSWLDAFRALPVLAICVALLVGLAYVAGWGHGWVTRPRFVILICWAVYALLLLLKIILNVRLYHYGFYLSMPAALLGIVFVVGFLPALLPPQAKAARFVWHTLMVTLLVPCVGTFLDNSARYYQLKRHSIGSGGDLIVTYVPHLFGRMVDQKTEIFEKMLDYCANHLPPGATLTCMPEGIMVNYLLRRENPVPPVSFGEGDLDFWGEPHVLEKLQQQPPDYILLIQRNYDERGVGPFGVDPRNGREIMRWIRSKYQLMHLVGDMPFESDPEDWGMALLQRKY